MIQHSDVLVRIKQKAFVIFNVFFYYNEKFLLHFEPE